MGVQKRSVAFDSALWDRLSARLAAGHGRDTVSSFVGRAVDDLLAREDGLRAMADWQAEHGAFSEEERADAARLLHDALSAPAINVPATKPDGSDSSPLPAIRLVYRLLETVEALAPGDPERVGAAIPGVRMTTADLVAAKVVIRVEAGRVSFGPIGASSDEITAITPEAFVAIEGWIAERAA